MQNSETELKTLLNEVQNHSMSNIKRLLIKNSKSEAKNLKNRNVESLDEQYYETVNEKFRNEIVNIIN